MIKHLFRFRFVFSLAVFFLLVNSLIFLIAAMRESVDGILAFYRTGFTVTDAEHPGLHLLESLDLFTISLIFMIFALGLGRLFIFDAVPNEKLPRWLRINNLKELKIMLWEAILLTLLVFSITHLAKGDLYSVKILIFPGVILVLSVSLFFVRWEKGSGK